MSPSMIMLYITHILLIQRSLLWILILFFIIWRKHSWEKQWTAWSRIINVLIIMRLNICTTSRPPRSSLWFIKLIPSSNHSTTNHAHTLFYIFTVAWSRATVIRITLIPYLHVGIYDLLKRVVSFELIIRWLYASHDLFNAFSNRYFRFIFAPLFVVHGQCLSWDTVMRIRQLLIILLISLGIDPLFPLILPPVLNRLCFIVLVCPKVQISILCRLGTIVNWSRYSCICCHYRTGIVDVHVL